MLEHLTIDCQLDTQTAQKAWFWEAFAYGLGHGKYHGDRDTGAAACVQSVRTESEPTDRVKQLFPAGVAWEWT